MRYAAAGVAAGGKSMRKSACEGVADDIENVSQAALKQNRMSRLKRYQQPSSRPRLIWRVCEPRSSRFTPLATVAH